MALLIILSGSISATLLLLHPTHTSKNASSKLQKMSSALPSLMRRRIQTTEIIVLPMTSLQPALFSRGRSEIVKLYSAITILIFSSLAAPTYYHRVLEILLASSAGWIAAACG